MSFFFLHQDQGDKVTIATPDTGGTPFCCFEDVVLEGGRRATVLRENPAGRELPIGDPKEVGSVVASSLGGMVFARVDPRPGQPLLQHVFGLLEDLFNLSLFDCELLQFWVFLH